MPDPTIISFSNHKGGTGKTTSTVNVGCALRDMGKKVLLIDLDPQANLTYSFGLSDFQFGIKEVLATTCAVEQAYCHSGGVFVIPMRARTANEEGVLPSTFTNLLIQQLLSELPFDYILLDCPPATGKITKLALAASDFVIVPMLLEILSIQGLEQILAFVKEVQLTINSKLQVLGVLAVCVNDSRKLSSEVLEYVSQQYEVNVFNNRIHNNVKAAEAPSFAKSVIDYAPTSLSARDYKAVAGELLNLIQSIDRYQKTLIDK